MSIRGQVPRDLRHMCKPENSDDDTDDDDQKVQNQDMSFDYRSYDSKFEINDQYFRQVVSQEREKKQKRSQYLQEADFYSRDDPDVILRTSKKLTKKQKLAFYGSPDYCFIVAKERMDVMREALEDLTQSGGIFYSTYERDDNEDQMIVVIYFDDILIDLMGELLDMQCRLSINDCNATFKCFAADLYEQFNNRQI